MEKKEIRFLILSLMMFSSCELNDLFNVLGNAYDPAGGGPYWKIIPAGLTTKVSGQFYEVNRNSPIADLTVYVAEYNIDPVSGLTLSARIDSTRTDQDGNYQISFVTTGKGVQYQIIFKWPDSNWWVNSGYPWVIENMGADNNINIYISELSILEAKIKVVDNLYPPMRAGTHYLTSYELYGANKDTTLFLRVMPNRKNKVFFIIYVDTLSTHYYRERIDTLNLEGDYSDTVYAAFELHPTQFKRRN